MIFSRWNGIKHHFATKLTPKMILFMISKAEKRYCFWFLLFQIGNLWWSWFNFTSHFKACESKKDYFISHDDKNNTFYDLFCDSSSWGDYIPAKFIHIVVFTV